MTTIENAPYVTAVSGMIRDRLAAAEAELAGHPLVREISTLRAMLAVAEGGAGHTETPAPSEDPTEPVAEAQPSGNGRVTATPGRPEPTRPGRGNNRAKIDEQSMAAWIEARKAEPFTLQDAATHFGVGANAVRHWFNEFVEKGVIKKAQKVRGGRSSWKVCREPVAAERLADLAVKRGSAVPGTAAGASKSKFTADKDLRVVLNKVRQQGGRVEPLGNDHLRIWNADGQHKQCSSSPSHQGTLDHIRRDLRGLGFDV